AHDGHAHVTLIDVSRTAPRAVASTLEADDTARLLAAVESRRSARPAAGAPGDDHFPIALDGGETRAAVAPLFGDEAKALLASIVPLDQKRAAIDAVRWPLLIGAAAMLVVLLAFAWMLQRRVFKPVADLGDLSERMLRGDYKLVARTDGSPDVARIGAAINKLLTDLRGYKEAIEQRQKRP
ncbi:MAG: methyl-accepting chemotaxis protein, partial [Xanthomonadales bacterium]|nr:methyl-accepting chemotaxis protein [Xanthomonadales bacterium]